MMFIRTIASYVVWWLARKVIYRLISGFNSDFLWDWYTAMSKTSRKIQGNANGPWPKP